MFRLFFCLFALSVLLVSCGSGSNSSETSTPSITGLQGEIEAIEPLNID